jgi:hypothetical protein
MLDWPTIINFGLPTVLLAVIGIALWRVIVFAGRKLFGDERKGSPGLIDTWLANLAARMQEHEKEQRDIGDRAAAHAKVSDEALRVLIDRDEPPVGAAYVASQAIYKTAANVEVIIAELKRLDEAHLVSKAAVEEMRKFEIEVREAHKRQEANQQAIIDKLP